MLHVFPALIFLLLRVRGRQAPPLEPAPDDADAAPADPLRLRLDGGSEVYVFGGATTPESHLALVSDAVLQLAKGVPSTCFCNLAEDNKPAADASWDPSAACTCRSRASGVELSKGLRPRPLKLDHYGLEEKPVPGGLPRFRHATSEGGPSLVVDGLVLSLDASDRHSRPDGNTCLLYTSPSPRDLSTSRMPSSA